MKKAFLSLAVLLVSISSQANKTIELTPKNTVVLRGPVTAGSVQATQQKLMDLNSQRSILNKGPIYLVLDSPGGSIIDGLDLISTIKSIPNVNTISYFAASMASSIAEQTPGTRYVKSSGIMMFHRAAGGVSGSFETGTLESQLDLFKRIVRGMELVSSTRMGITLEDYKKQVANELWIYGQENVQKKTADEVANVSCSKELIDQKDVLQLESFFGKVNLEFSGCPEFRGPTKVRDDSKEIFEQNKDVILKLIGPGFSGVK